jgi:phospholipid/cholesterol/gamma-HCH transport system substrate-binding protein
MKNFQIFSDSLKRMELNKTMLKTQQAVTRFSEIVARLDTGDNTASKLLTEDSLYVNLNKLLVSVDSLARHFDSNPRHFLAPLGKSQKKIEKARNK